MQRALFRSVSTATRAVRAPAAAATGAVSESVTDDKRIFQAEILSGAPPSLTSHPVRIYRPANTPTQNGSARFNHWKIDFDTQDRWENSLMGWASSADPVQALSIKFLTKEDAILFAERQGYDYWVDLPKEAAFKPKLYADNFKIYQVNISETRTSRMGDTSPNNQDSSHEMNVETFEMTGVAVSAPSPAPVLPELPLNDQPDVTPGKQNDAEPAEVELASLKVAAASLPLLASHSSLDPSPAETVTVAVHDHEQPNNNAVNNEDDALKEENENTVGELVMPEKRGMARFRDIVTRRLASQIRAPSVIHELAQTEDGNAPQPPPHPPSAPALTKLVKLLLLSKPKVAPVLEGKKASGSLTSNYGTSFAIDVGETDTVGVTVRQSALPSNIHFSYKPSIASASVLGPESRNQLTGRKISDSLAPSLTLHGHFSKSQASLMKSHTQLNMKPYIEKSNLRLSRVDTTGNIESSSRVSTVVSDSVDGLLQSGGRNSSTTKRRSSQTFMKRRNSNSFLDIKGDPGIPGLAVNLINDDAVQKIPDWHARSPSDSTEAELCQDSGPKSYFETYRKLPWKTHKETELPFIKALHSTVEELDHEHAENMDALNSQSLKYDAQKPRPSFIPLPTAKMPQERVEIIPLSLVESLQNILAAISNEPASADQDPAVITSSPDDLATEAVKTAVAPPKTTRKKAERPKTVPANTMRPAAGVRPFRSAKPGLGSKLLAQPKAEGRCSTNNTMRSTVLNRSGFQTEVSRAHSLVMDPMGAVLSTHVNSAVRTLDPDRQRPNSASNKKTLGSRPGPMLPVLESRPITQLLRTRTREVQTMDRQFRADQAISAASQPLPITRYVPCAQKKASEHARKLAGLRAQQESRLHAAYLGCTAVAPTTFMTHARAVVANKLESNLIFGGLVQGLAPTFNADLPSHRVYENLGKVHWQEYDQQSRQADGGFSNETAAVQGKEEAFSGETRRMLDDMLRRHGITRLGDPGGDGSTVPHRKVVTRQLQTTLSDAHRSKLTSDQQGGSKKISRGGGFIYAKSNAMMDEDVLPNKVAKNPKQLEQLCINVLH
ncbi:hypothetical protein HDU80_009436 [Chytriomyces hyalinus]|nr:hypothetical protein HDU80_009436 [Chytriomyces hyalinus]